MRRVSVWRHLPLAALAVGAVLAAAGCGGERVSRPRTGTVTSVVIQPAQEPPPAPGDTAAQTPGSTAP